MRLLTLPDGHTVKLAASIFELPAGVYNDFQYWLLRDSGIGSGADALARHFAEVSTRLAACATDDTQVGPAADELALLFFAYNDTLDKLNPLQLAFGCLVAEVDGQAQTDRSEAGLRRLLDQLSGWGLTQGDVQQEVEAIKKELRLN